MWSTIAGSVTLSRSLPPCAATAMSLSRTEPSSARAKPANRWSLGKVRSWGWGRLSPVTSLPIPRSSEIQRGRCGRFEMHGSEQPGLTVLIVTYNHEAYIRQAVESVLMQKLSERYQVIVADDGSTDKT